MSKNILEDMAARLDKAHAAVKIIPGVLGAVALIVEFFQKNRLVFYLGIYLIGLTILWFFIKRIIKRITDRKKPGEVIIDPISPGPSAYIRGLLPFEQRDKLLGRDNERRDINTIINSSDFKFGYISGEAGAGKTSFLRSIVIKEAIDSGMFPLSIKSIGGSPVKAVNQAISKATDHAISGDKLSDNMMKIGEKERKEILVIIDQFEEFFIGIKSIDERRDIINEIVGLLNLDKVNVKLLLAIRKEFVDDLQEFHPLVEQPTDVRFALRVKNWDVVMARKILDSIVEIDKLRFSEQLRIELVNDLATDGYVRPVEFQIVAKSLLENNVHDFKAYLAKGRATGVLAAYIKEIIEPRESDIQELEKQVTRTILRVLCDDKNDTKRAVALAYHELRNYVKNTINGGDHKVLMTNDEHFDRVFSIALTKLFKQYILKYEDDRKINLIHDYIVNAIRLATANMDTTEEQANRMLKKYLEDQKSIPGFTIPRKHYRFIRKNASLELKNNNNSVRLLKRTKRTILAYNALPFIAALVLVTALLPPKKMEVKTALYSDRNIRWTVSRNGKILVADTEDSTLIWQIGAKLQLTKRMGKSLLIQFSENGQWLAISDSDKVSVYQNFSDTALVQKVVIPEGALNFKCYGFIEDKNLFYLGGKKGNLYLIDLSKENNHPSPFIPNYNHANQYVNYTIELWVSPGRKYLCGIRQSADMNRQEKYISNDFFRMSLNKENMPELECLVTKIPNRSDGFGIELSNDDSLIAYRLGEVVYLSEFKSMQIMNGNSLSSPVFSDTIDGLNLNYNMNYNMKFSPDNKWLLARRALGCTHVISVKDKKKYKLENSTGYGSTVRSDFEFTANGSYCCFKDRNENLYLVKMEDISNNNVPFKPIIVNEVGGGMLTGLQGSEVSSAIKLNKSNELAIANTLSGYVYAWKVGSLPDLKKSIVYYDDANQVEVRWSNTEDIVYTISNNRIHFGNVFDKLKQINVEIEAPIQDITTDRDSTFLFICSRNELSAVERKLYLWNWIPIRSYKWPTIAECKREWW
jgi:hypothetical protein